MAQATIPEVDLLVSVDTNDTDTWPTFELIDVDVVDSGGRHVSLLGLSDGMSRKLTGQLQPLLDEQAHLLKIRSLRRAPCIELVNVSKCSFELDDADLVLRAAGQAGWYRLQSSEAYHATWEDMKAALKMLHWLTNAHKQRSTTKKSKTALPYQDWPVEKLFEAYGSEHFGRPKMAPEAAQKISQHKEFLLESMLSEKADLDWTKTPLYLHLAKKFPKQLKAAKSYLSSSNTKRSHAALPIRSSAATSKRKREAAVIEESEDIDTLEDKPHIADKPKSKRAASQQHDSSPRGQQYPSTPKMNSGPDRRQYAMKGRSALRPSAAKPSRGPQYNTRQQIEDSASSSEDDESTPGEQAAHSDSLSDSDSVAEQPETLNATQVATNEESASQMEVWQCTFTGCTHKIAAASEPDLQMLSEEHVALHAYDNDARVRLVQQLEHASLPVSHLMERVRHQARAEHLNMSRTGNTGAPAS